MELSILHTNDFHGTLTPEKAVQIAQLKQDRTALYFDCGDCVKAGNLAIPLKPERCWPLLAEAGCDAGAIGNRESHLLPSAFFAKIAGHQHPLLCANLRAKDGSRPLPSHLTLEHQGCSVGVIGTMVAMVTPRMATQAASSYLWDPPIPAVAALAVELRTRVDCLIVLSHIGYKQDIEMATRVPELDLILGGHSHTVLSQPTVVGNTAICQGGSHGRYLGSYRWEKGEGLVTAELVELGGIQK